MDCKDEPNDYPMECEDIVEGHKKNAIEKGIEERKS